MTSIGDFAEKLILNQVGSIKEGTEVLPSAADNGLAPAGKDISNVKVPDAFMKEILGESYSPQETPPAEGIPELVWNGDEPEQPIQALTEETAQQLVPLLEEVKNLLKEMTAAATTSGQIGTNMGGAPSKDNESWKKMEKSYGYIQSTPSNLPGTTPKKTRKAVLKASIKSKLKNK